MEKKDINNCMLFKLREEGLCIILQTLNDLVFYNKERVVSGYLGGLISLGRYKNNLLHIEEFNHYDIIAVKQFNSMNEVLYYILNNIEPKEWDWVREEKKKVKSVKLPVCIRSRNK